MKILHTSDWHLGKQLYGTHRYPEFKAFLEWLSTTAQEQSIDIVIVAGDIFDTQTPGLQAQTLYYEFLARVLKTSCSHVVVIAGNHDSAYLLETPKTILKTLQVHIVGQVSEKPEDEVLLLKDRNTHRPQAIVCAVPFLRDKDIRQAQAGESQADKNKKTIEGIYDHYEKVFAIAKSQQQALASKEGLIPVIATGHLFAAGGKTTETDGVRDLYVGNLGHLHADFLKDKADYVALGHLHLAQKVGGSEFVRYCGSPIAMGFGEANQQKIVCLVEFQNDLYGIQTTVQELKIPCFQKLKSIQGDWDHIQHQISQLKKSKESYFLEIVYDGQEVMSQLHQKIIDLVDNSSLQVLHTQNNFQRQTLLQQVPTERDLPSMGEKEVFQQLLELRKIPPEQRTTLEECYDLALQALQQHP